MTTISSALAEKLPARPNLWSMQQRADQRSHFADFAQAQGANLNTTRAPDQVAYSLSLSNEAGKGAVASSEWTHEPGALHVVDQITLSSGASLSREMSLTKTEDGFQHSIETQNARGDTRTLVTTGTRTDDGIQVTRTLTLADGKTYSHDGLRRGGSLDIHS